MVLFVEVRFLCSLESNVKCAESESLVVVLFVEWRYMGGLNVTNVRREIIPLLFGAQEEKWCSPVFF